MTGGKSTASKPKVVRKPVGDKKIYLILDKSKFAPGVTKNDLVQKTTTSVAEIIPLLENDPNAVVVTVTVPRNPRNKVTAGTGT